MRLIDGNAAFAGTAGIGASGAVAVVDKNTEAFIGQHAEVTARGKAAGVLVNTGQYEIGYVTHADGDGNVGRPDYQITNLTGDTDEDGNDIIDEDDRIDNQSLTMDRVATLQTRSIKGLAVSATTKDHIESIAAGGAVSGTASVSAAATVSTVWNDTRAFIADGAQINQNNTDAGADQTVFVGAGTDYYHLGVAGTLAGSGTAGVGPGADISVVSNSTEAFVGRSAVISSMRDIEVKASAHEDILSIAAAAAAGGAAGVAGGASINYIDNRTHAYVDNAARLAAEGNVIVVSDDVTNTDVIAGVLGLGIGAGVGQALDVSVINKDTQAYLGDDVVADAKGNSGGYLRVFTGDVDSAGNRTEKNMKGLLVQASSQEDIFNVVASGGAGIWAGVAGAVTVNKVSSNTAAYIGDRAKVNTDPTGAGSAQAISVIAVNDVKARSITGSAGGAFVGVSGAVDIGIVDNNTAAFTGENATLGAKSDIGIVTLSGKNLQNYSLGHAGGFVGVTGGVSVWSVGSDLDLDQETPVGDLWSALESEDGGSVEGLIGRHLYDADAANGVRQADLARIDNRNGGDEGKSFGDLGFVNVVDFLLGGYIGDTQDTIDGYQGSSEPGAIQPGYGWSGGRRQKGCRSGQPRRRWAEAGHEPQCLSSQRNHGLCRRWLQLGGPECSGHGPGRPGLRPDSAWGVDRSRGCGCRRQYLDAGCLADAHLGRNVVLNATGSVKVGSTLNQHHDLDTIAGTLGFFGNLGGSVAYVNDKSSSHAHVGDGARIASDSDILVLAGSVHNSNILALNAGTSIGSINGTVVWHETSGGTSATVGSDTKLASGGTVAVRATSGIDMQAEAYAPSVGAFLGLGAAVAILHDASQTEASVGAATEVTEARAVEVEATYAPHVDAYTHGVGVGGVAVGAAVSRAEVSGSVRSILGHGVKIGQLQGLTVGSLLVNALINLADGAQETAVAQTDGGASSGAVGAVGSDATAIVNPWVSAYIGGNAHIKTLQDIGVYATSLASAQAKARGLNISTAGVGVSLAEAFLTPHIRSYVGQSSVVNSGGSITVQSRHNTDRQGQLLADMKAEASAWSATGTLVGGGNGADAEADASADMDTYVAGGTGSSLQAAGTVSIISTSGNRATALG
jgi:hypothetical protein